MQIKWDDILLRSLTKEDIPPYAYYWFHCPDSKHIHDQINYKNFPTEEKFIETMMRRLEKGVDTLTFVVEFKGKAIGVHNLTSMKEGKADMHAHFWDVSARGKGIGNISGVKALKAFFEKYKLEKISLKPPVDNPMSTRLMVKTGAKKTGQNIDDSPFLVENVVTDIYEVTLSDVIDYENKIKALF